MSVCQNGKSARVNRLPFWQGLLCCALRFCGLRFHESADEIREHGTTLGEKRVGIGFNPSGDNAVAQIKRLAADFIDRVNAIEPGAFEDPGEVGRLKALAMTHAENAASWGVKAATRAKAS